MVSERFTQPLRLQPTLRVPPQVAPLILVLAGCAGIAGFIYLAQYWALILPMMAVSGLLLGLFVVVRPAIGMVTLVVCAGAVRVSVSTGTGTPIVASLVVAGVLLAGWIVHRVLHRQRLVLLPRSVTIPAAMLVGATFLSLVWGRLSLDPRVVYVPGFIRVQVAAAALTFIAVGLVFVGADLMRDRQVRALVCAAIVAIGFVALPFRFLAQPVPILNAAGLFGVWFVAICWANALVNDSLPDPLRLALGLLAQGWLAMGLFIERSWVSGWLPALIAMVGVTIIARPRLGFAFVILGVVIVAFSQSLFYEILITDQRRDGSLGGDFGRLELWKRNLEVVSDHLLFGTGPAGYALYYMTFLPNQAMSTHSNYVDILAQNGIFGLLGLLGLLAALFFMARKTLGTARHPADRATAAAIAGGIPAVALALWLGDWLIPFVYNQTLAGFDHAVYSWLMFAMLAGLATQLRRDLATDA